MIAVWAVLFALAGPFSGKVADVLSNGGFEVPGSQSLNVIHALDAAGGRGAQSFTLLVDAPTAAEARARLAAVRSEVAARFPQLHAVAPPQASRDGRSIALFTVAPVTQSQSLKLAHQIAGAVQHAGGAVRTFVLGPGATYDTFQRVSQDGILQAEIIGLPVALAVLLLLFGTLVAGVLPLVLGAAAVTISLGLLYWIARLTEVSVFAQQMTTMIGLGVAIDYSLFIVARFREELAVGRERADAVRTAMRTSGTAVVFSGITVIVSLGTVWIVPVRAVQSMAAGAMLVVAVAVVAAATLLPALLHVVGGRIDSLSLRRRRAPATPGGSSFWQRFARAVMARPVVSFVAAAGLLAVLALPAFSLVTANTSLAQLPRGEAVVRGNDVLVRQITGPGQGREGALIVLVRPGRFGPAPAAAGAERLAAKLLADPRVASTHVERVGDAYEVVAPLRIDPEGPTAVNGLVPDVRALVGALRLEPAARVDVGGLSAFQRDLNETVGGDLWLLIVALLVLAYLVLLVMLRSLLLPLKAVIMNLLSIGAAYGVIVAVFQWGWLDCTGFHHLGYDQHADAAARPRDHLRPLDGLRGLPALAHPRALRGDRRHRPCRRRGARRRAPA